MHNDDKVIIYEKGNIVFAFNFSPMQSFEDYFVPVASEGTYEVVLSSDDKKFGGFDRVDTAYRYTAKPTADGRIGFNCYLPSRTATVFKKV